VQQPDGRAAAGAGVESRHDGVRVEVNAGTTHQVMEGFGATTASLIYQNGADDKVPAALRTRAVQAAYRDVRLTLGNVGWDSGSRRTTTRTRCT
jgi:O-glycosyl hydrolase